MGKTNKIKKIEESKVTAVREKFDEVFEGEIKLFLGMNGIEIIKNDTCKFFEKYIGKLAIIEGSDRIKVKIKAKKGKIVIEKLKEM